MPIHKSFLAPRAGVVDPDIAPTMTPRTLNDGHGWCVLVTWPEGREMHLNGFVSEDEAVAWIENDSAKWILPGSPTEALA